MRMKLATVALLLMALSSLTFSDAKPGGFARQAAMGGSQFGSGVILNPFIMDDPSQMFVNPAYQSMYKDYFFSNIGGGTLLGSSTGDNGYGLQNAGVNFSLGREWSLGAIFSYDPSAVNGLSFLLSPPAIPGLPPGFPPITPITQRGTQAIPPVLNTWEVLGSYDAGALDLGFGITYGYAWTDSKTQLSAPNPIGTSETEASANMFGVRVGANYDMGGGSSIEGALSFRMDKVNDIAKVDSPLVGSTGEYSAKATEIIFHGRAKLKMSNKVNFVPYGFLAIVNGEPKEDQAPRGLMPTTFKIDASALAYGIGLGGEYRTPDFYLAGGISYQHADVKVEYGDTAQSKITASYNAIPTINLGAEWMLTDWMSARAGYFRSMGNLKNEAETRGFTGEMTTTLPFSNILIGGLNPSTWDGIVTLGVGFRFGNFSLDATVSEEALRRGLGLIGAGDNLNTFGYMNAAYNFN